MRQTNILPSILDAHGSYSIELEDVNSYSIDVNFIIEHNNQNRQYSVRHKAYNGRTSIRLDAVLKSIYELELYQFNQFKPTAKLTIQIADFVKTFRVVNAALQFGDGKTMDNYVNKRLGYADRSILFLGYPKTTSILRSNGIEMINNSAGCPFNEEEIDSNVHIKIELPNGQIVEADNSHDLTIADDNSANGVYTITYTTTAGDELVREFRVVNAGEETIPPSSELDLIFMRASEDIGNEYAFLQESYRDNIRIFLEVDFTTDSNTQYRFKITSPSNDVYQTSYEYRNWININPYVDTTADSYKAEDVGVYTIEAWILHEGQEVYHYESFNILSIQHSSQSDDGQITILQELGGFNPPMIMGDNITIKRINGNPFRMVLQDTAYTQDVIWELTYPDNNVQSITNEYTRLMYSSTEAYDFIITQSGEYHIKAIFNGQSLERVININVL